MGKVTKKQMPNWAKAGHRAPVTRREFLACGLIPFIGEMVLPGGLGLLSSIANAAECPPPESMIPFVQINLQGGFGIFGNFVFRDIGGQVLSDMSVVGLGTNKSATGGSNLPLESEFGVQSWAGTINGQLTSQLIAGVRSSAKASTLANTSMVAVAVASGDDTEDNKLNPTGMLYKAGLLGSHLPHMETFSNPRIRKSLTPASFSPPAPLTVTSFTDIANAVGYTASLKANLNTAQQQKLSNLIGNLNASQARKFASVNSVAQVTDLINCAGLKSTSLLAVGSAAIDPVSQNSALASLWGVNANTAATNESRVFSAMVYNALAAKSGSVILNKGDYDYHGRGRGTTDQMDNQAGVLLGRVLESAAIMNQKIFVYLTTDGAVVSNKSDNVTLAWTSDAGNSRGGALFFMYDPAGRPATTGFQLGAYTKNQVVDSTTLVGTSAEVATQAVFANYLQFNKKLGLFTQIVPSSSINASTLDEVIKVA